MTERSIMFLAEINGRPASVDEVWTFGHTINHGEYKWLTALAPLQKRK